MKQQYRCVNCGNPAEALFKTYGPSVLKLTKCVRTIKMFRYLFTIVKDEKLHV
jgi:hypothetical protein